MFQRCRHGRLRVPAEDNEAQARGKPPAPFQQAERFCAPAQPLRPPGEQVC